MEYILTNDMRRKPDVEHIGGERTRDELESCENCWKGAFDDNYIKNPWAYHLLCKLLLSALSQQIIIPTSIWFVE